MGATNYGRRRRPIPPQVSCDGCGKPMGRSWRAFVLCDDCKKDRTNHLSDMLRERRAERERRRNA